jgi:hypothetical protein
MRAANVNIDTRQLADGGRPMLPPSAVSSGESFFAAGGAGARLERPLRQSAGGGGDGPVYANASRIDGGSKYQPPAAYTPSSAEERVRPRPNDQGDQSSRSQLSNIRYVPFLSICIQCVAKQHQVCTVLEHLHSICC